MDNTMASIMRLLDAPKVYAYVTADVTVYDGSDTNAYGEECLEGHGYDVESGWIDPTWSRTTVYDEVDGIDPLTYDPEEYDTVAEWKRAVLEEHLGAYENDGGDTYYASDSVDNYGDGRDYRYAVHFRSEPFG